MEQVNQWLWAKKSDKNGELQWLPLKNHLEDTRCVMALLWEHWLSDGVKEYLSRSIEGSNDDSLEEAKKLCMFLGAAHDLGKATPIFQVKKSFRPQDDLDYFMISQLEKAGFTGIEKFAASKKENIWHNESGQYLLGKYGVNFCLANIVGSHHGRPISRHTADHNSSYTSSYYQEEDPSKEIHKYWEKTQEDIIQWALKESGYPSPQDLPLVSQPGQALLAGLLIMADWITSNEAYFPLINIYQGRVSQTRLQDGFTKWQYNKRQAWQPRDYFQGIYHERFDFIDYPKEEQEKISRAIDLIEKPGIVILEAPMGMGKTETALVAVEQLAKKTGRTGMFFALPTQATSNGIFSRVKKWLSQAEDSKSVRLMHGKAALNEEFANLPKSSNIHEDDEISVNEWFTGRKLRILDDFIVGTVDQVLLAALKQKHLMLRHLGLANKVLVIDEVHAYDAYMNTYLYQALKWMGAYGVPVVILSATLPIQKRNELLKSYMVGAGYKFRHLEKPKNFQSNEAYPLLTYHDGKQIKQLDDFNQVAGKNFEIIKKSKEESQDLVGLIQDLGSDGGIIGVVVNTVKKAQKFAKDCMEAFGEENVDLLHSSFIATDRYAKEKNLLDTIGKEGDRPKFKVVIGTQVIEQSLDIDFDLLVSDLAPMDLILQRMGRLHRHLRQDRPEKLKEPKVYILNCGGFDFDMPSTYVYDPYLLFRTEYFLKDQINLPNDISHLVQEVYGDKDLEIQGEDYTRYLNYQEKSLTNRKKKELKAKAYRIDSPKTNKISEDKNLSEWIENSNKESEKSEIKAYAQVRDSQDTVEVIALKKGENGYEFFDKKMKLDPRDNKMAMEMAKRTIRLPAASYYGHGVDQLIQFLEDYYQENLRDWDQQDWLKGSLGLVFDENNEFKLFDKILKYDRKYGLTIEKEEEDE
ncbi:CRISPR-associated helicase/endonuclease Cas3 [Urinicoccus timonensis]|uniref:CRISPR-associated helicase/endonuclease Cas3 n=1 Tax=Urinicoccus timonensis TaxID=2024205 RepID=UPI000C07ED95|nr:CRISPR-associated helicase/endonuclease Cas3 [Urinicoccus timonensis]